MKSLSIAESIPVTLLHTPAEGVLGLTLDDIYRKSGVSTPYTTEDGLQRLYALFLVTPSDTFRWGYAKHRAQIKWNRTELGDLVSANLIKMGVIK